MGLDVVFEYLRKRLGCIYCSIIMIGIEKKKRLLLRLFVFLLCCAIHHVAQPQDSLFYSQQLSAWEGKQSDVQRWKRTLDSLSTTVDSIKKALFWGRTVPDSTDLHSSLVLLAATGKEITANINNIETARNTWMSMPAEALEDQDSSVIEELLVTDSIQQVVKSLVDTLPPLRRGFERLADDITYLQDWIARQQVLVAAPVTADSSISEVAPVRQRVIRTVRANLGKDGSSVAFFDYTAWSGRLSLILISLLYFYWMYKLGRKTDEREDELRLYQNEPLWIPFLKACIFFLVLLPFTSFSVPVIVLEVSYLLVFIFLYMITYRELSRFKRNVLGLIFIYYIILIIANLLLSTSWWSKAFALLANVLGVVVVWFMGRRVDVDNPVGYIHRYARWAIMAGHVIAMILTIMGYISLSRMWSLAAGIGLLQAISLRAVREMLLHDIENQYKWVKPDAVFRRFDLNRMLHSVNRMILFCSGALVVLVLVNNLHLARETQSVAERLLMAEHKIGGITFTYANLLLAIAVIWVANWFQRNLKNLIDDTSPYNEVQVRKMTLFPLFRLLIIVVGFLIGLSILGFGVDKLTVIIGALSVGIGLGLQNIINNFVSGIILVFEKPFKIGDYIELADKKGQVMEIGIRSSTLLTDEGTRVIIPNGDLLSGRLVNWTFSESDIRVNLTLTVDGSIPITEFKQELEAKIIRFEEVDRTIPVKIFTKEITADNYQLIIQVGVRHVRYIERFRSQFLESLKKEMDVREIKVSSG